MFHFKPIEIGSHGLMTVVPVYSLQTVDHIYSLQTVDPIHSLLTGHICDLLTLDLIYSSQIGYK